MKRSRSDLLTVILQQLSTSIGNASAANWNPLSEEVADCTVRPFLTHSNQNEFKKKILFFAANLHKYKHSIYASQ